MPVAALKKMKFCGAPVPSAGRYLSMVAVQPRHHTILHGPELCLSLSLSTCYWEVLVTLDSVVRQASIEICNGFLANFMSNHGPQSEGGRSVLEVRSYLLSTPVRGIIEK